MAGPTDVRFALFGGFVPAGKRPDVCGVATCDANSASFATLLACCFNKSKAEGEGVLAPPAPLAVASAGEDGDDVAAGEVFAPGDVAGGVLVVAPAIVRTEAGGE